MDGKHGVVRIGDQSDPAFLKSVVEEMGGIDVVLDDGSHQHAATSWRASQALFPRLAIGGIYMIEDLHSAYLARATAAGMEAPGNFFDVVSKLIDDMHALVPRRHRDRHVRTGVCADGVAREGIVYDRRCVVRRRRRRAEPPDAFEGRLEQTAPRPRRTLARREGTGGRAWPTCAS